MLYSEKNLMSIYFYKGKSYKYTPSHLHTTHILG